MYILVDLWFLFPNLCVSQLYVSSIVGSSCGGLNEPEAWKLHVLGLYFYMYFACFCSVKNLKRNTTREKPGKSPRTPQESPGTPVNFFFGLDHSEVQRFFPFSDVCLCEMAMETRETFEALLVGLTQLKHLQKPLVCPKEGKNEPHALKPACCARQAVWSRKKTLDMCAVFSWKRVKPLKWPNRRVMSLKPLSGSTDSVSESTDSKVYGLRKSSSGSLDSERPDAAVRLESWRTFEKRHKKFSWIFLNLKSKWAFGRLSRASQMGVGVARFESDQTSLVIWLCRAWMVEV